MNQCLCCKDRLIKHLDTTRIYWFCPSCHQEMPNAEAIENGLKVEKQLMTQK